MSVSSKASTTINTPASQLSNDKMKVQFEAALKEFAKSQFSVDDLVDTVEDPTISIFIQNLLSRTKSKSYSRKQVPGVHKALLEFLKMKDIHVSHDGTEDNQLI
eukprot:13304639-Ditylum_brightwellii.AAC.1